MLSLCHKINIMLTPSKHTGIYSNLFSLTYLGVKYKVQFYLDGEDGNSWFCTAFNNNGKFDLYEDGDNHNLCAFPTLKGFKSFVEALASANNLKIISQDKWDEINLTD